MASTAPSKSHPLHNFELSRLKWSKDANSTPHPKRRRSIISPTRRRNPSSLSPLIDSPMPDSVSATPPQPHRQSPLRDSITAAAATTPRLQSAPRLQSPLRDFIPAPAPRRRSPLPDFPAEPPRRQSPFGEHSAAAKASSFSSRESSDYWVKQSTFSGEPSSKLMKKSPIGGDVAKRSPVRVDSVRKSQIGGELLNRSPVRGDLAWHFPKSEALKRSRGAASIEHRKNHSKSPAPGFDGLRIGGFNSLNNSEPERSNEKLEKKSKTVEVKKPSKILIKIPLKKNNNNNNNKKPEENLPVQEPPKVEPTAEVNKTVEVQEEEKINDDDNNNNNNNNMSIDEETKIWNLRPRKSKSTRKPLNGNGGGGGGAPKNGGSTTMPEKNKAQSSPMKNVNNKSGGKEVCVGGSSGGEKKEKEKEKRKLSINVSLTKEEIEEDIFAMTGSKPARRPKKRAKNIQKQLDYVFPGLWLQSITPESYKVSENYMKG